MPNIAAIISKHNKIALQNRADSRRTTPSCNCGNKANCPLEGKCRESSIIYKATRKSNSPYQPAAKSCNLFLAEKLAILQSNPATALNKRSELNSKCRHRNKVQIAKFHCVVLLSNVIPNVVLISSYHVPTPARAFNAMLTSYAFSYDFALVHYQPTCNNHVFF